METLKLYLSQSYLGNTLDTYLYFFLIIFVFAIVAKIVYYIFKHRLRKITDKTKTKLDEMIIDMVEEPITLIIVILGFYIAFKVLTLSEGAAAFVNRVILIVFLISATWLIVRLVDVIIKGVLSPLVSKTESKLDDQIIPIVSNIIKAAVWIMVIIVLLSELGYDVFSLITGLGLGGVAIAMAAKDTLGHMFGGFNIFMNKPFQIDDTVAAKGHEGVIEEVGIRTTVMRTWDDTKVYIPNSEIANSTMENISARRGRRVVLTIRVSSDTGAAALEKAADKVKKVIASLDGIRKNVRSNFSDFGEFYLTLEVVYWVDDMDNFFDIRHRTNLAIKKTLEDHKITLAQPILTRGG
jgi:MscS family membrane protein